MKTFIVASDQYLRIARVHVQLLKKYWPDVDVVVLGYQSPDFDMGTEFVSMGVQGPWANGPLAYFSTSSLTHFALALDDIVPVLPINVEHVSSLEREVREGRAAKAVLESNTTVYQNGWLSQVGNDLYQWRQDAPYRMTLSFSIWNRSYFLRYLEQDQSAWDFEMSGSHKARNDGETIVTMCEPICTSVNVFKRGSLDASFLATIPTMAPEDVSLLDIAIGGDRIN